MTDSTTPTSGIAVGSRFERGVRRAANAALDAYFFVGWWFSGALLCWLPLVFVPVDMARKKMTFWQAVRFEYRVFLRTMHGDRPRA